MVRMSQSPYLKKNYLIIMLIIVMTTYALYASPVKIMPLGDSITGSPGCWRALLYTTLMDNGYTDIDFVGTLPPQGCGIPYDGENEGHGGIWATHMVSNHQLPDWLSRTNPDIVMIHLGTNDIWNTTISTERIIEAYDTLVNQMRANNPKMKILVAQILPMTPNNCSSCAQAVVDLNNAIPGWANGKTTGSSPIFVVDQWTGFDSSVDTSDGVHPVNSGNVKIADKWYETLSSILSNNPQDTPTPTDPPQASLGDVNADGIIDIVDALLIAQYYVGLIQTFTAPDKGDTNCDNTIDIVDALLIAQYYVGLISKLVC